MKVTPRELGAWHARIFEVRIQVYWEYWYCGIIYVVKEPLDEAAQLWGSSLQCAALLARSDTATQGSSALSLAPIPPILATDSLSWHVPCLVEWISRITYFLFWKRFQKTKFSWLDYKSDPAENSKTWIMPNSWCILITFSCLLRLSKSLVGGVFIFCVYDYFALWPAGLNVQTQG